MRACRYRGLAGRPGQQLGTTAHNHPCWIKGAMGKGDRHPRSFVAPGEEVSVTMDTFRGPGCYTSQGFDTALRVTGQLECTPVMSYGRQPRSSCQDRVAGRHHSLPCLTQGIQANNNPRHYGFHTEIKPTKTVYKYVPE